MALDGASSTGSAEAGRLFATVPLGGLDIAATDRQRATARLCQAASTEHRQDGLAIHLVNAYTIALAARDREYACVLMDSHANLPDGKPLSWISRLRKSPVSQVRGPSLFTDVMDYGRNAGVRHFLLGATDDTLQKLNAQLVRNFPGVQIVGQFSPPFRKATTSELAAQDKMISDSQADVVWVGLGTPKQDFEVRRIAAELPVVAVAVGAAFDFVSGSKKEAPRWMTQMGIEWLYRLLSEPRRLWRRYLFGNFEFLWAVFRKR